MSYQILACGSNGNFQLGTGDDNDTDTLQHIDLPHSSKPRRFAFGGNHTLVLFEDGALYACGDNTHGQCGISGVVTVQKFTKVPGKWAEIAAGWEFSVLCAADGAVHVCGHGPKGELGLGPQITESPVPTRIELPPEVRGAEIAEIQASISHVLVRFSNGKFVGWGASRKGQLGPVTYETNAKGLRKPVSLYWRPCLVDIRGSLFCMGRDRTVVSGNLSETDVKDVAQGVSGTSGIRIIGKDPQVIACVPLKVRAMWSSVHYSQTSLNGIQIVSQGNNLHGQLFNFSTRIPIVDFEVGSEHGVVLLLDNSVHAWGWGEHGNCGPKAKESVTFDYLNQLYKGNHRVVQLACGLATTWVVIEH